MTAVATPRTRAERDRRARVVHAAEAMLAQDGEHGLQMKQLAERAELALATLYRYFPSKDHVLGAIALERQRRALQRISHAPVRSTSEYIEGISRLMERLVLAAIAKGGTPASDDQRRLVPIFLA